MSKYDGARISVANWDKYNPRKTTARPTWFRFENHIATGPGFFGLDAEQKWLWVVILSLVSQKNGEPIEWNSTYITAVTGIKPKKQDQTIEIFEKFVRLHVSRTETFRDRYPTDVRTNETNETDEHAQAPPAASRQFDLECLYRKYPRKIGKEQGLARAKAQIKTDADYEALSTAIDRYIEHLKTQCVEEKYIQHFSTFMNRWRDWCDPEAGESESFGNDGNVFRPLTEEDFK